MESKYNWEFDRIKEFGKLYVFNGQDFLIKKISFTGRNYLTPVEIYVLLINGKRVMQDNNKEERRWVNFESAVRYLRDNIEGKLSGFLEAQYLPSNP